MGKVQVAVPQTIVNAFVTVEVAKVIAGPVAVPPAIIVEVANVAHFTVPVAEIPETP